MDHQKNIENLLKKVEEELELIRIDNLPDAKEKLLEKLKKSDVSFSRDITHILLKDKEVFREVILYGDYFCSIKISAFEEFGEDSILEIFDTDFDKILRYFHFYKDFVNYEKLAMKILPKKPEFITYFSFNEKFIIKMMKINHVVYSYLPTNWKENRSIMIEYLFLTSDYHLPVGGIILAVKDGLIKKKN